MPKNNTPEAERVAYNSLFGECISAPKGTTSPSRQSTRGEGSSELSVLSESENEDYARAKDASNFQRNIYSILFENYELFNFIHGTCAIGNGSLYGQTPEECQKIETYSEKLSNDLSFAAANKLFLNIASHRKYKHEPKYYDFNENRAIPSSVFCYSPSSGRTLEETVRKSKENDKKADDFIEFEKRAIEKLIENYDLLDYINSCPTCDGFLFAQTESEREKANQYFSLIEQDEAFGYADTLFTSGLDLRKDKFERSVYDHVENRVMSRREIEDRYKSSCSGLSSAVPAASHTYTMPNLTNYNTINF